MNFYETTALIGATGYALGSVTYIRAVMQGKTRPHIFSWLLWGLVVFIGAAIQISQGSWPTALFLGLEGVVSFSVFILGFRQGDLDITRSDWAAFIAALLAIPVWLVTKEPLWAAILITGINIVATYPTYRKAWYKPQEENAFSFSFFTTVGILRLLSVSPFTLVTALYPACSLLLCGGLVALILLRKRKVLLQLTPA